MDVMDVMETRNITKSDDVATPQPEVLPRTARRIPSKEEWDAAHAAPPVPGPIPAVVEPTPEEPVPAPVPTPPAPVQQEIVVSEQWQATDDEGTPVGPPSKVFGKGATEVEALRDLSKKLKELNIIAARKIKEYRDKYRTYDRATNTFMLVEPKALTSEEKVSIARLLADPDTIDQGYAELYKAQFGESPDQARKRMAKEAEAASILEGKRQVSKFLSDHPDFPQNPTSQQVMLDEMDVMKAEAEAAGATFGFTAHNLEIAYDNLVEKGILIPIQLTVSEPTTKSQIAPISRNSQETPPQVATPAQPVAPTANTDVANGNLRPRGTRHSNMSAEHGEAPPTTHQADDVEFLKQVDSMPLEVLKRKIGSDRAFRDRLNSIKRRSSE
jgi:hypothetical protein